ncbi:fimbrial protein [Salmonella enterica]|nr:fimbrial protein [Salmonella enterica subsp. enterica]EDF8716832.1 fimbrial protein [Salmonella enterica]EDU8874935.1 fimbrial protein [Salmonella enterica subsp. enterica]EEH2565781.1 fimbrial protein [Salmonella enterica]
MKRVIATIILSLFLGMQMPPAATLTLRGIIVPYGSYCIINDGNTLEVSFGTIESDKIDGVNYLTDIPWTFQCHVIEQDMHNPVALKYEGTPTSYSSDAIATSIDGLGIVLQQDGEVFRPGDTLVLPNRRTQPALKAVPVKQPGKNLAGGHFDAYAVLIMEVQ